jgi:hypothetical protein
MAHTHIQALATRHKMIEGQIAQEMRRPVPDAVVLARLKREKLKVKDEIARQA